MQLLSVKEIFQIFERNINLFIDNENDYDDDGGDDDDDICV